MDKASSSLPGSMSQAPVKAVAASRDLFYLKIFCYIMGGRTCGKSIAGLLRLCDAIFKLLLPYGQLH